VNQYDVRSKPNPKIIMPIIKKITISIVIGLIAYAINELIQSGSINIPGAMPELGLLLLFIVTSLASQFVGGESYSDAEHEHEHDHDDDDGGERRYDSSDRETGTVKWFNVRKGYGFITRDAGDDVFVHFRNIEGSGRRAIEEGQRVSFVVTDGDKGLQADEVSPA
jgi:CspA family cold shock protein